MKRLLNKILKYLGLNLVKSKRARKPRATAAKRGPDSWDLKDGQTHSYGDSCPGGHYNDDLTDTCERPRVEQPTTKDTTGPTS